jgi:putative FmdB family regulatory protein
MPTYEYVCRTCDHAFEVFHSMSAKPIRKCPQCGKLGVKRLIGAGSGILFKGSGFYETDYKKKSPPASEKNPDPACQKKKYASTAVASGAKQRAKVSSDSCA